MEHSDNNCRNDDISDWKTDKLKEIIERLRAGEKIPAVIAYAHCKMYVSSHDDLKTFKPIIKSANYARICRRSTERRPSAMF